MYREKCPAKWHWFERDVLRHRILHTQLRKDQDRRENTDTKGEKISKNGVREKEREPVMQDS